MSQQQYKPKQFRIYLSQVDDFDKPNIKLEQYITPADITCTLFEIIEFDHQAISGKVVGDLCCGTCMYSIAAAYFEPAKILGFDIDRPALQTASENLQHYELTDAVELINCDLLALDTKYRGVFDTVVMNPPFGTKNNEGIDCKLLKVAFDCLKPGGQMFSLHKASTKSYIEKFVAE